MKLINFFLVKKLRMYLKRQDLFQKIFSNLCLLWFRYGTGTLTYQSRNRNRNFSKVGTETVKNCYCSTTLVT
jgi:hypothetical protein